MGLIDTGKENGHFEARKNILGISALYHDSAACMVVDGEIVAAAQEERFTRRKHDQSFPVNAINYCVKEAGIQNEHIDLVVYYDHPLYTMDRFISNVMSAGEDAKELVERSFESVFGEKLWIHKEVEWMLGKNANRRFLVCEHHVSHAASAFYPSPYEKAVILTLDGVGEWATTTIGVGDGGLIKLKEEIRYPHSLGLLYSAFTWFCGFKVNSGDYKFMGLAPYGEPVYEELIRREIIDIKEDGSFRLNLKYFDFQYGRAMTNDYFAELFGGPRRMPESRITKREMDIAASAQKVVEDVILRLVRHAKHKYGKEINNLVMAGGVALNCVANGKIMNAQVFRNIWIQPAAGDAGGALGAALYAAYNYAGIRRNVCLPDAQKGSLLGPQYTNDEIEGWLDAKGYAYQKYEDGDLFCRIAEELSAGRIIGCFHGRMEFGPRALGNRSIIADPRREDMQVKLNLKIKYRESFRPFAPAVLQEDAYQYFELDREKESPYMLIVQDVVKERRKGMDLKSKLGEAGDDMLKVVKESRSDIPAVTHVDYSARIQTVTEQSNPYFYRVLEEFKKLTGCSVVINTSFNVRGEPIVCTPQSAYECFMRTDMDVLVLEHCILKKEEQPEWIETQDWRRLYELD